MVRNVRVSEAAEALQELIQFVQQGNEVVLMDAGKPVAKLTAFTEQPSGSDEGTGSEDKWTTDDFNFSV
jgi:antitoxin (DNA-binding transcriptional repressor) of toxin-antitoxin stability system